MAPWNQSSRLDHTGLVRDMRGSGRTDHRHEDLAEISEMHIVGKTKWRHILEVELNEDEKNNKLELSLRWLVTI